MVGKWHLGAAQTSSLPKNRGFDKHFGMLMGWTDHWSHKWAPEDGNDRRALNISSDYDTLRGVDSGFICKCGTNRAL